ncbi:MAG TPA: protein kinase [Gemmatimonadaceae bacterium]|nr:protein kinase [Gemmatimonadaceae bacterium]
MPADIQESHHALALRPGALLADRFRIVRSARGTSPFAFSYQAEDLQNGDAVVIKEFFPRSLVSRAADGLAVRPHSTDCERDFLRALHRFALEGAVLADLSHPHLVRVRSVVNANQTVYVVMDRHETQPLADFVQPTQGRIAPPDAGRIVQQLLSALELLHAESIIHRDLSPRTVHVAEGGRALLLEFSARRHLPMHTTDLASGFAAFEQYGAKDIGPWTDVYAASALLYYLLTGLTPPSALERAAGEAVVSPLMAVPGLAPGLAGLVMRGMALLPQQRPHAVSELRRQLESALVEGRSSPPRAAYAPASPESSQRGDEGAGHQSEYDGVPLRLGAGGVVVPTEERSSIKLFRFLRGVAARFGGNQLPPERPDEMEQQIDALARASGTMPPRPTMVEERPAPIVAQPAFTPVVAVSAESALPVPAESSRQFEVSSDLVLPSDNLDAAFGRPSRRHRYSLAAAGMLVVVVGASMVFLARSGRASGTRTPSSPSPSTQAPASNAPAAAAIAPKHESVDGGAVLQSVARAADHPPVDAPASASKRTTATSERSTSSSPRVAEAPPAPVLPPGRLPNVKIAVAGSTSDLKIVPPELLVDERTRLTNGQDQLEQGDYAIARHTFRTAMAQLDSVAPRYPDSQAIRNLRREIEQADSRALQACTAENEMRKRRGEEARACQ